MVVCEPQGFDEKCSTMTRIARISGMIRRSPEDGQLYLTDALFPECHPHLQLTTTQEDAVLNLEKSASVQMEVIEQEGSFTVTSADGFQHIEVFINPHTKWIHRLIFHRRMGLPKVSVGLSPWSNQLSQRISLEAPRAAKPIGFSSPPATNQTTDQTLLLDFSSRFAVRIKGIRDYCEYTASSSSSTSSKPAAIQAFKPLVTLSIWYNVGDKGFVNEQNQAVLNHAAHHTVPRAIPHGPPKAVVLTRPSVPSLHHSISRKKQLSSLDKRSTWTRKDPKSQSQTHLTAKASSSHVSPSLNDTAHLRNNMKSATGQLDSSALSPSAKFSQTKPEYNQSHLTKNDPAQSTTKLSQSGVIYSDVNTKNNQHTRQLISSPASGSTFSWLAATAGLILLVWAVNWIRHRQNAHQELHQRQLDNQANYKSTLAKQTMGPSPLTSPLPKMGARNTNSNQAHNAGAEKKSKSRVRDVLGAI